MPRHPCRILGRALLAAALLLAGLSPAAANCRDLAGFAIFQCASSAYFEPVPDPAFRPRIDPLTGRITNVRAVYWQIGFGNALLNTGLGASGTGNAGPTVFNGNDSGIVPVDLAEAAPILDHPSLPEGALCIRNGNWGNLGVDGCCDNPRDLQQPAADDGRLNPYFDIQYDLYGYHGIYSLDWQQDAPMAILLTTEDGLWFAVAAVASLDRGSTGGDGLCAAVPGTNPAACDYRPGYYDLGDLSDGLPNPTLPGASNVIPWQATPRPSVLSADRINPGDANSPLEVTLAWDAVWVPGDGSRRPSTNPALHGPDLPGGVGVLDAADPEGLVRFVLEIAPASDTGFMQPTQVLKTRSAGTTVTVERTDCARLATRFGAKPRTAQTTVANCRRGLCGDIGYEVLSRPVCFQSDTDGDGLPAWEDNCPGTWNPLQDDRDRDGIGNPCDNCPGDSNPRQEDRDLDGPGDPCDNCPSHYNPGQEDSDGDGEGNACDGGTGGGNCDPAVDGDRDGDGIANPCDNCPDLANPSQADWDLDGVGSPCDNCVATYNPGQEDQDGDGVGDVCWAYRPQPVCDASDGDADLDTHGDLCDNCPDVPNTWQTDSDRDGLGNWCDVCPASAGPSGDPTDTDGDGVSDECDVCPWLWVPYRVQEDLDFDGVGDHCDNCLLTPNPSQVDLNGNGIGDHCDWIPADPNLAPPLVPDVDGDGILNGQDNCIRIVNPGQEDADYDGDGDPCDSCLDAWDPTQGDADGDGIGDACDNCASTFNMDQADSDGDGIGDLCDWGVISGGCDPSVDGDQDGDGVADPCDNCPWTANPGQGDVDGDGVGDACEAILHPGGGCDPAIDGDQDGDGIGDPCDNCPRTPNPWQIDEQGNGVGDACEGSWAGDCWFPGSDSDGDGIEDACDNCPQVQNLMQSDADMDWIGDACDNCPAVHNPRREDSDGDGIGDACDLIIVSPGPGSEFDCSSPPMIIWEPRSYERFQVQIAWEPDFRPEHLTRSEGWKWGMTSWTVPLHRWRRPCQAAHPDLYIRVLGLKRNETTPESSETIVVTVP